MRIIIIILLLLNNVNSIFSNSTTVPDFISTITTEFDNPSTITTESTTTTTTDPCANNNFEINVKIKEFSIILLWPSDNCPNRTFEIYLNNTLVSVTNKTNVIIEHLHACTFYQIEVLSNNQYIFNQLIQTNPPIPFDYTVDNLQLKQINTILKATWDLPDTIANCINYFNITTRDKYEIVDNTRRSSELNVDNQKDCKTLWVKVTPIINQTIIGLPTIRFKTIRLPPETPILNVSKIGVNSVILQWSPIDNLCESPTIITTCQDNQRKIEHKLMTQRNRIKFKNLAKLTNYSCRALAINTIGNSTWSPIIEFTTDPDVPLPPTNLTITDITSNQFKIQWNPSIDIHENVTGYRIFIENLGPANHRVGDSCLNTTNSSIITIDREYIYNGAFPDFRYLISINALNDYGESTSISQEIITDIAQSEEVVNFGISEHQLTENNTIELQINWEEPCNSNGPLKNYTVTYIGIYQSPEEFDGIDNGTITLPPGAQALILSELHPSFIYNFTIFAIGLDDLKGKSVTITYHTQDGVPNPPVIQNITNQSPEIFEIFWIDADEKFGKITNYTIDIEVLGPNFTIPENCPQINFTKHFTKEIPSNFSSYQFKQVQPYFQYTVRISAATTAGYGEKSPGYSHTSQAAKPEPARSLSISTPLQHQDVYNESATITFQSSCRLNGAFANYSLYMNGSRLNYNNHEIAKNSNQTSIDINLKPDYNYTIEIYVSNGEFQSDSIQIQYHSDPGVPTLNPNYKPQLFNSTTSKTVVLLKFSKDLFNVSYSGDLHYYALFLIPQTLQLTTNYGYWSDIWPTLSTNSTDNIHQLTTNFWYPFSENVSEIFIQIGNDDEDSDQHLQENTEYSIIIRGLTNKTYRDSEKIDFKTGVESVNLALVLGLTFGILIIITLIISFMILKRRYQQKTTIQEPMSIVTINIKKFIPHYQHLIRNSNILKTEFQLIETKSKEFDLPTTYATLPENRRKNRYTNILPFDETRVKLQEIDEDDEISSDYINASYIKGYSDKIEYIATQGPTEATCRDFWKMILQENVTMVVMVSQFVEQNKEKCHRYFPNNNEKLSFNENFEIRCLTELDFGNYCVRTLQIKKDNIQRTLTHIQYLEWPDFGVPTSTDSMLQFCYQIRDRIGSEGGLIVVHCSAGVGRTGTLIAIDILLQTIDNHQDIDIFNTVLNLRQQRINMVQTEKQYMFIYSCIKDFLENPITKSAKKEEPIYENVAIKSELNDNLIATDIESSF